MGAMLVQEGPEGVEHAVYYLSKKFLPYEEKYNLVEKNMFDHDLGYKETKALFPVLQNTGYLKNRSIEVFIAST